MALTSIAVVLVMLLSYVSLIVAFQRMKLKTVPLLLNNHIIQNKPLIPLHSKDINSNTAVRYNTLKDNSHDDVIITINKFQRDKIIGNIIKGVQVASVITAGILAPTHDNSCSCSSCSGIILHVDITVIVVNAAEKTTHD